MGTIADYGSRDALGLAELVRTKQVSALELVDECIARDFETGTWIVGMLGRTIDGPSLEGARRRLQAMSPWRDRKAVVDAGSERAS